MTLNRETMLRAYPGMPSQVNGRMDATLAVIRRDAAAQNAPKRYAVRLRFATVVIALVLLLAAIGVAAGIHFGVFDFMARMFGQSDVLPQASELVQSDLATLETEHTSIALTQAVYDGGNLRVVYSVRVKGADAPITDAELADEASAFRQALAADGVSPWGCDWFCLDGEEHSMTGGSTGDTIPGAENGEALCYLDIYLASSGIVPQGDFAVSLPIIRRGRGEITTLDFTVRAAAAPTLPPTLSANGAAVTVLSASLSPVRAYISLRIERNADTSARDFELLLADWRDAVLADARGEALCALSEWMVNSADENAAEYTFIFLPTDAAEAYLAPTILDDNDEWLVDMSQAIRVK